MAYFNKVNSLNDDIRKSGEKVDEAEEKVKDILMDLPGQLDKTIPLATESLDANRDISLARTQGQFARNYSYFVTIFLKQREDRK